RAEGEQKAGAKTHTKDLRKGDAMEWAQGSYSSAADGKLWRECSAGVVTSAWRAAACCFDCCSSCFTSGPKPGASFWFTAGNLALPARPSTTSFFISSVVPLKVRRKFGSPCVNANTVFCESACLGATNWNHVPLLNAKTTWLSPTSEMK